MAAKSKQAESDRPPRAPGMRRGRTRKVEDWAVRHVNDVIADEFGWHFGRDPLPDYGVDALAEVVGDDDLVTGRLLGIQVKGSEKRFSGARGTGWPFSDHNDHLAYWLSYSVPVIVVLVNKQREAFWQAVTPETVTERRDRFSMTVPWHQPFDATARAALLALARQGGGMLESLPAHYAVLPPAAIGPLRRAEASDHYGAARLAERLASGREQPGLTAAMLVAAQPLWIVNSSAAQDLWLAVGVYAEQHGKSAEAGRAFAEAAQVPGSRTAQAAAAAGMAFLGSDRIAARGHLLQARAAGLILPADAALSMLDLPEDDWRPPLIPPSVGAASRQELEEWPNVLAFLAEEAARRGSLDEAVGYAERAVESAGNQAAPLKLTLGRYVQRRAAAGDMSVRQQRRAARLAREVVDDRRRWDGPSGEALAFLLDIQLPVDAAAAVREALPASEGGVATDAEAGMLEVASRGALAATIAGNTGAFDFFLRRLPDGPHRSEVLALQAEQAGQPAAASIAVWSRVLEEAADHAMATWCIISLARLGHWPARAEEMHDRGIVPDDAYAVLKAVCQCNSGDAALGLARLRALAETSAMAAGEFVALIEQLEGAVKAIEECERQAARWHAPALIQRLLDLHGRAGDPDRAAELIGRVLPDDSFPAEARLGLCTWLTARKCGEQEYADAVTVASRGLEIGDDPDLAWLLVKALFNDGKVTRARQVLGRHQLKPAGSAETHLWLMLRRGVPLSPDDARTMTTIARQETDPALREAAVGILIREVLHGPDGTAVAWDPDIVEEVALLRDEAAARDGGGPSPAGQDGTVPASGAGAAEPQAVDARRLLRDVRAGRSSQADIGRLAGLPYAAVLLRRPALIHPAADLRPALGQPAEGRAAGTFRRGLRRGPVLPAPAQPARCGRPGPYPLCPPPDHHRLAGDPQPGRQPRPSAKPQRRGA